MALPVPDSLISASECADDLFSYLVHVYFSLKVMSISSERRVVEWLEMLCLQISFWSDGNKHFQSIQFLRGIFFLF